MTITIEPNDFGQDIVDSISPFLGAFGLLDASGNLDINNWSMEKALGVFSTFERTELILNTLSGFVSSPTYVLREKSTGLIVESGELPPSETREEEWFAIHKGEGWSVNLTVVHEKLEDFALSDPSLGSPHSIELGIGLHLDDKVITLPSSSELVFSGHLGIPIVQIKNKFDSTNNNYEVLADIPQVIFNRLIWCDPSDPTLPNNAPFELWRIALSAKVSPDSSVNQGRFNANPPSASAIALRTAFGKESSNGANDGLVAYLSLLDFIARENDIPTALEIDLVSIVSGGLSGVLDSIIPALIELLPPGAERFADNLLPMLGLLDSDWSAYPDIISGTSYVAGQIVHYGGNYYEVMVDGTADDTQGPDPTHDSNSTVTAWGVSLQHVTLTLPNWPRIDIVALIGDLDDLDVAWTRIKTWLLELTQPEVATQWLTHLYDLIFDDNPPAGKISGNCTIDDPISLELIYIPGVSVNTGVSVNLLIALWTDTDGSTMLDAGIRVSADQEILGGYEAEGGMTVWLVSVPLSGGRPITFIPELFADFIIGKTGTELLSLSAGENTASGSSPLANLAIDIEEARLGVNLARDAGIDPIVELLNVTIGTGGSAQNYPVVDLTSGASIMDALGGALTAVLDTVSDALANHKVLQWLGSLVGLVAPRGYPFRLVDTVLVDGDSYVEGELFYHTVNSSDEVYKVLTPNTAVDDTTTPVLTTAAGTQTVWGLTVEYVGPNTAIWETGGTTDKRIDLLDLVQDPLDTIQDYHRSLLDDTTFSFSGYTGSPWACIFEALGNLINTGLAPLMKLDAPEMLQDEALIVTGVGTDASPWRISLANDGDLPSFNLFAQVEDDGTRKDLGIGLGMRLSLLHLAKNVHLETNIDAELITLSLPDLTDTSGTTAMLLPGVEIQAILHDAINSEPLQIAKMRGLSISIDGVSAAFEWRRGDGLGWRVNLLAPRIGTVAPNLDALASSGQLSDVRDLASYHWNGYKLKGPYESLTPDLTNSQNSGDDPPDSTMDIDDQGTQITVTWTFFGFGCTAITFDSWQGLTGFISNSNAPVDSLIELDPGVSLIEDEGIRMILGNILAFKGGSIGFFFSAFLRINPHIIHLDLQSVISEANHSLDRSSAPALALPPAWKAMHPISDGRFGLGPFSLPYDWPDIGHSGGWADLIDSPLASLERFIVRVFSGVSESGEPFALPAMRWLQGLLSGSIPDLTRPDLGWPCTHAVVSVPTISVEVSGAGTHANPWALSMPFEQAKTDIEFLVWLGPDGPENGNEMQILYGSHMDEFSDILDEQNINPINVDVSSSSVWPQEAARLLKQLSSYSPRAKAAIGDSSMTRIASDLYSVDQFLKSGDGISITKSQKATSDSLIETTQAKGSLGDHVEMLASTTIGEEVIDFLLEHSPASWDPSTGQSGTDPYIVVLIGCLENPPDIWNEIQTQIELTWQCSVSPVHINWSDPNQQLDLTMIANRQLTLSSNIGLLTVHLSNYLASGLDWETGSSAQIKHTLDTILSAFPTGNIVVVAHSLAGIQAINSVRLYEGTPLESRVLGLLTIATPHEGSGLDEMTLQSVRRGLHLLSLLVMESSSPTPHSLGVDNQTLDLVRLRNLLASVIAVNTIEGVII